MFTFSHFFLGLFFIVIGVIMVKYNFKLVGLTGRQDWIENVLGSGTTYLAFQVFAVGLVILGIVLATGLGGNLGHIILDPLKSLFPALPSGR
jgi:hypothetical protein